MNLFKGFAERVLSWFNPPVKKKYKHNPKHGPYRLLWNSKEKGTYRISKHGLLRRNISKPV